MSRSGVYTHAARVTVLFADDDTDTRFAYQSLAISEGFLVELAADGPEALLLANIVHPDAIVLDVRLRPPLDGFEVARRLRASPHTRAIPIAFVGGDGRGKMRLAVGAAGFEGYLAKPCSADELLALLNKLTSQNNGPAIRAGAR